MYQLSEDEIVLVDARLQLEQLGNQSLERELLDHICCVMESLMHQPADFESAYRQACLMVYPNGPREIEEETFFLLTFNKQTNMKRILFSAGFLSTFLISFGFMFKFFHWPGANIVFISGLAILFITLGVLLVYSSKTLRTQPQATRIRVLTGLVSGALIAAGSIFKILWYPGANMMIFTGMLMLNLVFLPMFFYQLYKKSMA